MNRKGRLPVTHDLNSLPITSLWSVDVVSEAEPGPGQEATLGSMGAAERHKGWAGLRRSP